jgi:hypothetical protein
VVEHLFSICKALGLIPCTKQTNKKIPNFDLLLDLLDLPGVKEDFLKVAHLERKLSFAPLKLPPFLLSSWSFAWQVVYVSGRQFLMEPQI